MNPILAYLRPASYSSSHPIIPIPDYNNPPIPSVIPLIIILAKISAKCQKRNPITLTWS